ncbi:hypothetical protein DAI22_02g166350 [Oryza sativa Japonica Group]|nr:hypothetical protein DAI22_02g166350 [Oryza sativa Japonica Group]
MRQCVRQRRPAGAWCGCDQWARRARAAAVMPTGCRVRKLQPAGATGACGGGGGFIRCDRRRARMMAATSVSGGRVRPRRAADLYGCDDQQVCQFVADEFLSF